MGSTDKSFSLTGYEPKDCFLTETYVEFNQESMTEQRFPEDVDYDDAAIGEMLFNAYREQVYHSQREGLSVGQSSSSMSDRTVQPVVETGQEQNLEHAQIRTLLKSRNTSSRLIMTEEVYKKKVKRSSRSKKNFIALKQKNAIDEINNFFMKSY